MVVHILITCYRYIKPYVHFLVDGKDIGTYTLVDVYTRPIHAKTSCSCI